MHILSKAALVSLTSLSFSTAALAHTGDHSAISMSKIAHFLSSPSHALLALTALGATVIAAKIILSKRA